MYEVLDMKTNDEEFVFSYGVAPKSLRLSRKQKLP